MGLHGKLLFDLNELPTEEEVENDTITIYQPQKALPIANQHSSNNFPPSEGCPGILNNNAFTHASSGSGFQPFVRNKDFKRLKEWKQEGFKLNVDEVSTSVVARLKEDKKGVLVTSGGLDYQEGEREEGECSDMEGYKDELVDSSNTDSSILGVKKIRKQRELEPVAIKLDENNQHDSENSGTRNNEAGEEFKDLQSNETQWSESSKSVENSNKLYNTVDSSGETSLNVKSKEVKGIEVSNSLRFTNTLNKRSKHDEHKEAMLGKKRARQTVFINVEDIKQGGPIKSTTPRHQSSFPAPIVTRIVKDPSRGNPTRDEVRGGENKSKLMPKDLKLIDSMVSEGVSFTDSSEQKSEVNGDITSGVIARSNKFNKIDAYLDVHPPPYYRQGSWKQSVEPRQFKNPAPSTRKPPPTGLGVDSKGVSNKHPTKKQVSTSQQYQDTSVERLHREVMSDRFWHHPEETELQCVPGHFESVEEYVKVFEPLLFEECRAQLFNAYEEHQENTSRDANIMVHVKIVERRERGWYDVIVLPAHECKWNFKEGDVAVLSTSRPGSAVRSSRSNSNATTDDVDSEVNERIVGTVRRHVPIDTRDPPGAILHFFVGDCNDNSKLDDGHVLRKLRPRTIWYLTVLGSLATTQREYTALHAFRRLNMQMQNSILKPSPEHFPKYEEQTPGLPDCFTERFVDHLHKSFNSPQLAAIQWAAMHTAAGTTSGANKRQDPWPFTLVQGPPGTGKTHTVWGMLNVIHLVQYQHYYTALLKKLAPESYKQNIELNAESVATGSIDEVLQNMDQSLLRTLPKLCPKPRMLVCAPSNAATDELLARVLDRGFIDGEMKVYRPDVARVGVDSQTRAAQAVSVERRTEQLLLKGRDEVLGWLHQLKSHETSTAREISNLQRELTIAAAAGHSQGSVGVDPDVLAARDRTRDGLLQKLAAAVENRDKILVEMSRLLILESRFRAPSSFNLEDARANLEASFANEAEIVFTTVSSSGRKLFSRLAHGFDMVVIDEAAQASEVAVLPPLILGAARCVLVGDPQQLPATVISKAAGSLLYSRSLFERFQLAGCPTMLLSVQYRMHPQIRDFPSRHFYQGRLTDSESVASLPDEIYYRDPQLQPYIFYDMIHGRESHTSGSVSYQNVHEAQFALRLYEHLQKFINTNGGKKVSVGIITPYKLQLKCLQRAFQEVLKTDDGKDIYINTVDAFQGQERDVIIMSCVRASNHGVGFVADIRRMNVALTRARRALWVVGNANALVQSDDWAALVEDAKARRCFVDMDGLPKELVLKGWSGTHAKSYTSDHQSSSRSACRRRHLDMHQEPRSGSQSEDDEKSKLYMTRNGSYRTHKFKEVSLEASSYSRDQSRDSFFYAVGKRQNLYGSSRRDI